MSSDTIRLALNANIYPRNSQGGGYAILEPIIWELVEQTVAMLLEAGHSVAIDATKLTKSRRLFWRNMARSVVPDIEVSIVWCAGKWDSPLRWIEERGVSEEEYWQIRSKLEASVEVPTADEVKSP